LFLIGGLNFLPEARKRMYHKQIIRLDIFDLIAGSELPAIHLAPADQRIGRPRCDFRELRQLGAQELDRFAQDTRLTELAALFDSHQETPYPAEDFTFIFGSVCSTAILHQRVGRVSLVELPRIFTNDFVFYLYTGMIRPSPISSVRSFVQFLRFCWRLRLYRLMWLEICANANDLSPASILEIASMTDGDVTLVEDLLIVKYVMFKVFKELGKDLTFEGVPNLHLIANYLILLLDETPQFPALPELRIPQSTVLFDLFQFFPTFSIQCKDCVLRFDNQIYQLPIDRVSECSRTVIYSILNLNIESLLREESPASDLIEGLRLLNMVGIDSIISSFLESDVPRTIAKIRAAPIVKSLLHEFLPEIRFFPLLQGVVRLIGFDSISVLVDRKGNELRFDSTSSVTQRSFCRVEFDVSPRLLFAVAYILYTNAAPEGVPAFFNSREVAQAALAAMGDYPQLFGLELVRAYRLFILREMVDQEGVISNAVVVKNFVRWFRLGLVADVARRSDPGKWIRDVAKLENVADKNVHMFMFRVVTKAVGIDPDDKEKLMELFDG
jgi:hypothetical protein